MQRRDLGVDRVIDGLVLGLGWVAVRLLVVVVWMLDWWVQHTRAGVSAARVVGR